MFPLHPETPEEGKSLEELFNTNSAQITRMVDHLKQTATSLGLEFGDRKMTYNSRLAQELGIWADEQGCGDGFHLAAFKAYFADGENLAKTEVLLKIAARAGLREELAKQVLASRSHSALVDADWELSRSSGITAAPTFVMGSSRLVGAQDYPTLQGLMLQHGVAKR